MKKIFLTAATIGLLGTSVFAFDGGKKTEKVIPVTYSVENQFDSEFSNAKEVAWTVTSNVQKATFTVDGVAMTAFYSLQNDFLGVTTDVDYSEVANKAKVEIADQYKGYTVGEVIKLETPDTDSSFDSTVYFVDLKNDAKEVLVRVTPSASVYFFKQVK
jgi:hypothetical protein